MTENNRKQNNIYSITLFNKVIYFYISPGGASRSLFIEMIPVDSEYRAYGGFILLWFGSFEQINIISMNIPKLT